MYLGNFPEKQPMDNMLNKDQHKTVDQHVVLSQTLSGEKADGCVFSLATPKLGSAAYLRIVHPDMGVAPLRLTISLKTVPCLGINQSNH